MNKRKEDLIKILVEYFAREYKSYDIEKAMQSYGLTPDNTLDPYHSKRLFAKSGLTKLTDQEIDTLAKKISKNAEDADLNKQLEPFLGDSIFEIKFITRRKLAEFLDEKSDFEGNLRLIEFLESIWELERTITTGGEFDEKVWTIRDYILQFAVNDKCMSYKEMLLDVLQLRYVNDSMLIKFIEKMVNPEVRTGKNQSEYVTALNEIMNSDGFELINSERRGEENFYELKKIKVFHKNIKNLVFASNGVKPDIVIENAMSNDIKIINDDDCLHYMFKPDMDGLLWKELVKWWSHNVEFGTNEKNELYKRLKQSLDSEVEKEFFYEYYHQFGQDPNCPALIPQVYLHYDPRTLKQRNNVAVFPHQRMDFLMLLPKGVCLVFEIDGKQHYSDNDKSSPKLYASMAEDTRDLQLRGYEVYRFGGYELMTKDKAAQTVKIFFDRLFEKYQILNK